MLIWFFVACPPREVLKSLGRQRARYHTTRSEQMDYGKPGVNNLQDGTWFSGPDRECCGHLATCSTGETGEVLQSTVQHRWRLAQATHGRPAGWDATYESTALDTDRSSKAAIRSTSSRPGGSRYPDIKNVE